MVKHQETGSTVTATSFPITVGGGGSGGSGGPNRGNNQGSNSVFSTITSAGGGFGAGKIPGPTPNRFGGGQVVQEWSILFTRWRSMVIHLQ